ncbi:3D domain-containing protein [Clostridium tunisiense]|uniref:3D domain-containing protein n=1 Tax=Clostridium tunisiense TaxID=219748 RepID=UPI0002F4BEB9|nr:3D domain-containing protein [Clostridium tunisiense]
MNIIAKDKLKKYFSIWPKTLFIVALVLMCTTITILNLRKDITVVIDGKETKITTLAKNLNKVFEDYGISVGEKDKVSMTLDSEVKDGDIIYISKAVEIEVNVDGKDLTLASAEPTVKDLLAVENITLEAEDKIVPALEKPLENGMKIQITRVKREILNEVQEIAFETEVRKNNDLAEGTQQVVQEGSSGEKAITTEVVYEDGKEVNRKVVEEKVQKNPIKKIVNIGTLGVLRPSRGGEVLYTKKLSFSSTAYTADRGDASDRTATGTKCRRDPNGYSTVAVDPRVIPLGTKLYIEGYGYAIAEDTGGAIKGNIIDVYFNTYSEMMNWGRRRINVYIIK